jgi:DNA-binding PadR family transcriptional regulator
MRSDETEQRTAGYITIPMVVLDGWVGHNDRYLKWWTWLRREACWTEREVWFNRQQVYLQARQVIVTVNLLVKRWGVSKPTIIRFLHRLEQDKLIERQIDNHKTIITITLLGWADLEVKPEVKETVKVDNQVDRQTYPQAYPTPFKDKEINIIAGGGARTREEAVAINDFDEIIEFFNQQMTGKVIPQVVLKTPERRQAFEQLIAQTGIDKESVKQAIVNAAASDFLNGKGQKGWIADFDWIMVPQHFQKVLENFYRNKQVSQTYGTTNGYQDPRRGVEVSRTDSFAAGYDRPL